MDRSTDLLNQLANGEDEFDVDLMACGCRLAETANLTKKLTINDLVRIYKLDQDGLESLVGALIDEGKVSGDKVMELAEKVSKGRYKEAGRKQ